MAAFRYIVFGIIVSLILEFPVLAAEEFKDVPPDKVIGQGEHVLRVKISDPVTQQAWVNKPYHLIAYGEDGKAATVIYGNTDNQGYTATLKSAKNISNFAARPKVQAGQFPYITQMRMLNSFEESAAANTYYVHFFGEGAVYTGICDERGDVSEVGTATPQSVRTEILGSYKKIEACDWQTAATILNKSIDSTPSQRIELIKQVSKLPAVKDKNGHKCESFYEQFDDELNLQMLKAAAAGGAELLNSTAPVFVDKKADLLAKDAKDSVTRKQDAAKEYRIIAILNMLDEVVGKFSLTTGFISQWADQATTLLSKTKNYNDSGVSLNLAEKFVALKEYSLANKFNLLAKSNRGQTREADKARLLAVDAMIAKSTGDKEKAQKLFELANNWLLDSEKDVLVKYRTEFANVPFGKMRISASMLQDAMQWCPQISDRDNSLVIMFPFADEIDETMMSRMLTLDALLSYGTAKSGKVALSKTCINNAPQTFELTKQDIEKIRKAKMLGSILLLSDAEKHYANAPRMRLALLAWLQAAKLAPDFYKPNKTAEKVNIGF
jgi:hypothetical protein